MKVRYRDKRSLDPELHEWYYMDVPGTASDAAIKCGELEDDGWEVEYVEAQSK